MTLDTALQPSARPRQGSTAVERRRSPAAFRGSLERRLPASSQVAETEWLLPPVGRSEAFAEDLLDDTLATAVGGAAAARRRGRLRWLGLPVLGLSLGLTLGLGGLGGMTGLIGF